MVNGTHSLGGRPDYSRNFVESIVLRRETTTPLRIISFLFSGENYLAGVASYLGSSERRA